jgi:hypothetical protein
MGEESVKELLGKVDEGRRVGVDAGRRAVGGCMKRSKRQQ